MTKTCLIILGSIVFIGVLYSCSSKNKQKGGYNVTESRTILYHNQKVAFQFHYSPKFRITHETVSDTSGWSYASTRRGKLLIQLKLKPSVQPKTNLAGATFTVGRTDNPKLLKKCMQKPAGYMLLADSLQKGERTYHRTKYSNAGAGNYYTVVQYRTVYQNYCYSIEEMVHITNIHNYPPERGISRFDSAKVWGKLDAAWQSFHF